MKTLLIVVGLGIEILYPSPEVCEIAAAQFEKEYGAICIPAGIPEEDRMAKMFNMMKVFIEDVESTQRKNP